jgi:3-deoxy-D-manno-octulosonic-acid transferase
MRFLYTLMLTLLSPFIVLRLLWKSRRLPAYRNRIAERFSLGLAKVESVDAWVHAVSLGEVVAASALIQALLDREYCVMVTTMTPTGSEQVMKRFGKRVLHQYMPYDLPWSIRRFFNIIKPRIGLIMETELWPNVITKAQQMKIPLLLINARLSDRAYPQYCKVRFLFKPLLNRLTAILAQSEKDAMRFIALGAAAEKVQVVGNIKFDLSPIVIDPVKFADFSKAFGTDRVVVIAASTHENEEAQILRRLPILQQAIPGVLLLIAPRHPERFLKVYELCQQQPFQVGLRSQLASLNDAVEVVVLDSLGELSLFYALSHFAFVGGSLVPIGGHNVLEAIAVNVPVFCGPYMNNSQSICDDLCRDGAMIQAKNADDLIQQIIALDQDPVARQAQIERAAAFLKANQGTLSRYLEWMDKVFEQQDTRVY